MRAKSNLVAILVCWLLSISIMPTQADELSPSAFSEQSITISAEPLEIGPYRGGNKISAPASFQQQYQAGAEPEDFLVTFDGDWTDEEKNAANYAASIWSFYLDPAVKISVRITKKPGNLGLATAYVHFLRDEHGWYNLPDGSLWYPFAIANHISGIDHWPASPDFDIHYDSSREWYYGTDGNPDPYHQFDFVTVILHEIGHGLGFCDSFWAYEKYENGKWIPVEGRWGRKGGFPHWYDTFVADAAGHSLLDTKLFPNPSLELGQILLDGQATFDGHYTRGGNFNQPAQLNGGYNSGAFYGPDHVHEIYNNSAEGLMTFSISRGESNHKPGPMTLGMLADLGWTLSVNVPAFTPMPFILMPANTKRLGALDLWSYLPAPLNPGTDFTYQIANTPAPEAGIILRDNRFIDIQPAENWLGQTDVTVQATKQDGYVTSETFTVRVVDAVYLAHLPLLRK